MLHPCTVREIARLQLPYLSSYRGCRIWVFPNGDDTPESGRGPSDHDPVIYPVSRVGGYDPPMRSGVPGIRCFHDYHALGYGNHPIGQQVLPSGDTAKTPGIMPGIPHEIKSDRDPAIVRAPRLRGGSDPSWDLQRPGSGFSTIIIRAVQAMPRTVSRYQDSLFTQWSLVMCRPSGMLSAGTGNPGIPEKAGKSAPIPRYTSLQRDHFHGHAHHHARLPDLPPHQHL